MHLSNERLDVRIAIGAARANQLKELGRFPFAQAGFGAIATTSRKRVIHVIIEFVAQAAHMMRGVIEQPLLCAFILLAEEGVTVGALDARRRFRKRPTRHAFDSTHIRERVVERRRERKRMVAGMRGCERAFYDQSSKS